MKTNDPCCLQWACSCKPWEILSVYLFPAAIQACMGLMDGSFSMAIHHVMSIYCGEENMFILILLCVMEFFNERMVFCLLRIAAVDHNEFAISWTSGNLASTVPISFLPAVLYLHFHLDPLMWSCSFWEHIDWPIWEKSRISNRFLKTEG